MVMTRSAPLCRLLLHNLQPWLVLHLILGAGFIDAASDCKNQLKAEGYIGDVVSFHVCNFDRPKVVLVQESLALYYPNMWAQDWLYWWDSVARAVRVVHRIKSGSSNNTLKISKKKGASLAWSEKFDLNLTNRGDPAILFQLQNDTLFVGNDSAPNVLSCVTKPPAKNMTIYNTSNLKTVEGKGVHSESSKKYELVLVIEAVGCDATGKYECEASYSDDLIQKKTLNVTHYFCPPIFGRRSLNVSYVKIGEPVSTKLVVLSSNLLDVDYNRWFKDGVPQNGTGPKISITRDGWQTYTVSWSMTPQDEADLSAERELRLKSIYSRGNDERDIYGSYKFDLKNTKDVDLDMFLMIIVTAMRMVDVCLLLL